MNLFTLYIRCFSRDWRVIDYGICDLMDLLMEIPDTTITITHQDTETVISVPKRGQFKALIKKTLIIQIFFSLIRVIDSLLFTRRAYSGGNGAH